MSPNAEGTDEPEAGVGNDYDKRTDRKDTTRVSGEPRHLKQFIDRNSTVRRFVGHDLRCEPIDGAVRAARQTSVSNNAASKFVPMLKVVREP